MCRSHSQHAPLRAAAAPLLAATALTLTSLTAGPATAGSGAGPGTLTPDTVTPGDPDARPEAGSGGRLLPHMETARRATNLGGTLVFIKRNNVWTSRSDGTGAVRLTKDGSASKPYATPSISDNGRIAAVRRGTISVLNQQGRLLNRMSPPDLFIDGAGTTMFTTPIMNPVISANGNTIAYSQLRTANYSGDLRTESLTAFTDALRFTNVTKHGLHLGNDPSWVSAKRVTVNDGGGINLLTLGARNSQPWFVADDIVEPENPWDWNEVHDADHTKNRNRVLFMMNSATLHFASVSGNPGATVPAPPSHFCSLYEETIPPKWKDESVYETPSWGPNGDSAAYEHWGAVWVINKVGACGATTTVTKILPGASEPDWSKVAHRKPAPVAKRFALKTRPKVKGVKLVGKRLNATRGVWTPAPRSATFRWLRNGKAIGGKRGARKVYKTVRADRGKRISVRVTVRRPGFKARSAVAAPVRIRLR